MRWQGRFRRALSWNAAHASPASRSKLAIVFRDTPVIRETERQEFPSTKAATTWVRFTGVRRFIVNSMLEYGSSVKWVVKYSS
jgi:hypothetical protein